MANKTHTIRIESILGGHSPMTHFASGDQYLASIGIDPSAPAGSTANTLGVAGEILDSISSGLIRPITVEGVGTTVAAPKWILTNPKQEGTVYIYDAYGSIYTSTDLLGSLTGLGDMNDGRTGTANGAAYYDNYMYFATDTTVARYGPLNGTPSFTDDYWVTTLGKTALSSTSYPTGFYWQTMYPNHVMHRHSDGKLYIADVVDNQGTIHYIKTRKTSVEGDTDDNSTYDKVNVGYGLWPFAMESYGDFLAIAFNEVPVQAGGATVKSERAKLAFWDTTSENVNQITWAEYPDQMITALKNVNGVLHVISGNSYKMGFRLMKYVGGNSFEHVAYIPSGDPSPVGAVDSDSNRLIFGSWAYAPIESGCVYSYGLPMIKSDGLYNVVPVRGHDSDGLLTKGAVTVSAVKMVGQPLLYGMNETQAVAGYTNMSQRHGVVTSISKDLSSNQYVNSCWWSQIYRIGSPFKITKIRIPITETLGTGASVVPKIRMDSNTSSQTLTTISRSNFGANTKSVVIRPQNLTGDNDFFLELLFSGSERTVVALPITIEYELIDVDTAYP
jgi:hypothetical protein